MYNVQVGDNIYIYNKIIMVIKIPNSNRKKALFIIDVQDSFYSKKDNVVIDNIKKIAKAPIYSLYILCTFRSTKSSIWYKQQNWLLDKEEKVNTDISNIIDKDKTVFLEKDTRSIFKWQINVEEILKENGIEENHIVWFETNDCVLASAFESFDLWYFTYISEEWCGNSDDYVAHEMGVNLLRNQNMTNNSIIEKIDFIDIS